MRLGQAARASVDAYASPSVQYCANRERDFSSLLHQRATAEAPNRLCSPREGGPGRGSGAAGPAGGFVFLPRYPRSATGFPQAFLYGLDEVVHLKRLSEHTLSIDTSERALGAGDDHDGQRSRSRMTREFRADAQPVDSRQDKIEHDKVRMAAIDHGECLHARPGFAGLEALRT